MIEKEHGGIGRREWGINTFLDLNNEKYEDLEIPGSVHWVTYWACYKYIIWFLELIWIFDVLFTSKWMLRLF